VPLCSCITGLGSEQPLLFDLLYSFVPTIKKKQKERELLLSTLLKRWVDKFIVLCIFLVMSCRVAPLNCLNYHVIGFWINQHCKWKRECIYSCVHKINTGVLPPIYAFLFRSLSNLQVRHLHPELVCRHFVQNTQRRGPTASMTLTTWPICLIWNLKYLNFGGRVAISGLLQTSFCVNWAFIIA
jgi:hypothetical protein